MLYPSHETRFFRQSRHERRFSRWLRNAIRDTDPSESHCCWTPRGAERSRILVRFWRLRWRCAGGGLRLRANGAGQHVVAETSAPEQSRGPEKTGRSPLTTPLIADAYYHRFAVLTPAIRPRHLSKSINILLFFLFFFSPQVNERFPMSTIVAKRFVDQRILTVVIERVRLRRKYSSKPLGNNCFFIPMDA